jgi:hypothetical protein
MALHQRVQKLLLLGTRLETPPAPPTPRAPAALQPLIEAIAPTYRRYDAQAMVFGNRYRSGYWSIYLLSAIAVLCAVLPLALGWDSSRHALHPYAGLWAVAEVCVIATVSAIYWRGHRGDWQGRWLTARTAAELCWYMPMIAPLIDFEAPGGEPNWYLRVFEPDAHLRDADEISTLCAQHEILAKTRLAGAWSDPAFVAAYAEWTAATLEGQRHYHHGVAGRQHALLHRVHRINSVLFGLTAVGATMHLIVHTLWLSLVTTFFPALGASLHGALAQSEAYRLGLTSERLEEELAEAIVHIRKAAAASVAGVSGVASVADVAAAPQAASLKASIRAALESILAEHEDWNLFVRPHRLPLG